ncbi:MAG: hypothetical protein HY835_12260, partial [Anaerolineae bacterium]|nr:hypothetical protein [Anaerolineae bacterium]
MKRFLACVMLMLLCACSPLAPAPTALPAVETPQASPTGTPTQPAPTATPQPSPSPLPPTPTPIPPVPAFEHIAIIVLENKDFDTIAGSPSMPFFNQLADGNTLLTQYYTPAHPSLPNYLALIGGDTFGVTRNCEDCFQQAPNLADLIEQSGRTWKTYQESMPEACYRGSSGAYVQKHNPFVYFDSIRLNPQRCQRSVVPLQALEADLAAGDLPNFIFITPDLCHSGHDCPREDVDDWLSQWVPRLQDGMGAQSLLVITFDEATGDDASGCCGMPEPAGGRVATLLVSPLVKQSFEDPTPYSHYSLLKTIAAAWNLPELGRATAPETALIQAPFQPPLRVSAFLIGAGDIGVCGSPGDEYTARLLDRLPGDIFTAGDNSNEAGLPEQYTECYETAWGRHKARIHPSPGNHDYQTDNGAGYHAYFGAAAGTPGQGWYSYDLGPWHIIALNGNCAQVGGCGADSAQMAWLLADLSASSAQCTLAYW